MPRLFLAFPADQATSSSLLQWQSKWPHPLPGVRWLHPDDWHITALFIGDVSEETAKQVHQLCIDNKWTPPPASLSFIRIETVYRKQRPMLWWARYENHPDWQSFYRQLYLDTERLTTLEPYRATAIPHITLARLRFTEDIPLPPWNDLAIPAEMPLSTLWMYESQLHPSGARYRPLYPVHLQND